MLAQGERAIHKSRDGYGDLIVADDAQFRTLYFGSRAKQSCILLEHPDILVLRYTQAMASALMFQPHAKKILMVGVGGGSLAKFFLKAIEYASIDAVELREAVIKVAHAYFYLPENEPRLRLFCQDGMQFVRDAEADQYDLIMVDAFDQLGPVNELVSEDFLRQCRRCLAPGGVLTMNLWNRSADQFKHKFREISALFERRALKLVLGKVDSNVVIFAFKGKRPELRRFKQQAVQVKSRFGIDAPLYLQTMQRQNSLLSLQGWL